MKCTVRIQETVGVTCFPVARSLKPKVYKKV